MVTWSLYRPGGFHSGTPMSCHTNTWVSLWYPDVLPHKYMGFLLVPRCPATQIHGFPSGTPMSCHTNTWVYFWYPDVLPHTYMGFFLVPRCPATQIHGFPSGTPMSCHIHTWVSFWYPDVLPHKYMSFLLVARCPATQIQLPMGIICKRYILCFLIFVKCIQFELNYVYAMVTQTWHSWINFAKRWTVK